MPLQVYYLNPEGKLETDLSETAITQAFRLQKGLLWVDVPDISVEDGAALERIFGFHHLAVEDCVSTVIHPPKVDAFGDNIFVIVHGINHSIESDIVETAELAFFLGSHYVVTAHSYPLYSVEEVRQAVERDGSPMKRGADFLVHAVLDALIDNVMPTIDRMIDIADILEEEVLTLRSRDVLDGILKLKRSAMKVHRIMSPQREVMNRLSRGEFPQIGENSRIYYRDVYDHVARIEDLNQTTLDRTDNALATYLSAVSNRQNETMRILSIVATIFMPLTLLAGIYGMNFEYMPELNWKWAYFVVLGVIVAVVLIMVWRFWASGWFHWGRRRLDFVKPFAVEAEKLRGYLSSNIKRRRAADEKEKPHEA